MGKKDRGGKGGDEEQPQKTGFFKRVFSSKSKKTDEQSLTSHGDPYKVKKAPKIKGRATQDPPPPPPPGQPPPPATPSSSGLSDVNPLLSPTPYRHDLDMTDMTPDPYRRQPSHPYDEPWMRAPPPTAASPAAPSPSFSTTTPTTHMPVKTPAWLAQREAGRLRFSGDEDDDEEGSGGGDHA